MRPGTADFTLKLLPFNFISNIRIQRTSPFFRQPYHMAESAGTSNIPVTHPIQPKPNVIAEKKEIPPPPEKPEAGDCCGSGCVRCVWDIYYDELEEYDKLYKQKKDPDPNPKP